MRRVVVTGLGMVAPTGVGVPAAWQTAVSGRSAISRITRFDTAGLPVQIAGEVGEFGATDLLGAKTVRQTSRFVQFAAVAAAEALRDAGYDADAHGPRCGCMIGVAIGGLGEIEESSITRHEHGASKVLPHTLPFAIPNMASGFVAIQHHLTGPNLVVATACASGTHAIGEAAMYIQNGKADMMLAGGAEAATCPLSIACFAKIRALSRRNDEPERASRPFDADRDGFVIGEGSGLLVLEEYEHARSRGATIYAELAGYGASADAYHITTPAPGGAGLAECMRECLRNGGIGLDQIDHINAHGTSTPTNDTLESEAIAAVFGAEAANISIASTKGVTGHCLGAAGGIEAVYAVLAVKHSLVPPTANYETPDPTCRLDYTPGEARHRSIRYALSNSSGFGGQNACLAFKRI